MDFKIFIHQIRDGVHTLTNEERPRCLPLAVGPSASFVSKALCRPINLPSCSNMYGCTVVSLRNRGYLRIAHGGHIKAYVRDVVALVLRLLGHDISPKNLTRLTQTTTYHKIVLDRRQQQFWCLLLGIAILMVLQALSLSENE